MGAAMDIWAHHIPKWRGLTSLIGRETYPALLTSTADEYWEMLKRLPSRLITSSSKPSKNTMGYVEWAVGGKTLLCSLKDSNTWESANLGFAWVDEANRQNPRVVRDLETRLRQQNAPRCMICTTNPAGKGWLYHMAHPEGKKRMPNWMWVEASTEDNPALPEDYKIRLRAKYGVNTPAYKRWVLGKSTALEGSVFTEFVPEAESCIHVIPAFELPPSFTFGRGMDYGMVNPTAVVWAGKDAWGNIWVDRCHYAPEDPDQRGEWTVPKHAAVILDNDEMYEQLDYVPADPSMWITREHPETGGVFCTADEFLDLGVDITPANNARESGLQALLDLIALDPERCHPVTLEAPSPRLFILDRTENEPLIQELTGLLWAKPEGTTEQGRPDDCQKKDDHAYDALRYLVMESPARIKETAPEAPTYQHQVVGSRGRVRRY
jgi:hypothetical protein